MNISKLLCALSIFFHFNLVTAKSVEFSIFTFNDVYDIHPKHDGIGGFSTLQTMLEKERQKVKHHITTMNGDFLFPSIYSSIDKGKHRVDLFNAMKVDFVVLGNHEFDFGPKIVKERMAESNFLWFGANVYDTDGNYFTGEKQTAIIEVEGVKIGFFGIVTNETPIVSSTENSVLFCPLKHTAKRMCKELKEQGADVIVALTHLFISEDLHLAEEVPEIDIILGGHDHDPIVWYQKETLIMKTGQNAYFLGKIDLQIEVSEVLNKRDVKIFPSFEILVNKNHLPNQEIAQKVSEFDNYFSEIGGKPLACIETALDSRHGVIRGSESTMGNLILDALREEFQTDAALMSGGIIRGDRYYPAGTAINYEDLMKELPFENENIVIEVSGSDILKVLETGVARAEYLSGAFPQVSGIEFFFNRGNSSGERIIEAKIKGHSIEPEKRYTLATNTFNQEGGDGYFSLCNGKVLIGSDQGGKLIDTVRRYLEKHPHLEVHLDGRIKMISATSALDAKKHWID